VVNGQRAIGSGGKGRGQKAEGRNGSRECNIPHDFRFSLFSSLTPLSTLSTLSALSTSYFIPPHLLLPGQLVNWLTRQLVNSSTGQPFFHHKYLLKEEVNEQ
jgi:hypothetical protein